MATRIGFDQAQATTLQVETLSGESKSGGGRRDVSVRFFKRTLYHFPFQKCGRLVQALIQANWYVWMSQRGMTVEAGPTQVEA